MNPDGLAFRQAVQNKDLEGLRATLATDVAFYSTLSHQPWRTRATVGELLSIPAQIFAFRDDFRYTRHLAGPDAWHALFFEGALPSGRTFEGVDYLHLDQHGLVDELRVLMRPLPQINEFATHAAELLERQGLTR